MSHKNFCLLLGSLVSAFLVLRMFFTLLVDPAGVFNLVDTGLAKDDFLKSRLVKYEKLRRAKPSSILFGGSRVAYMDSSYVERFVGGEVFNCGMTSPKLDELIYYLEYSIKNSKVETVFLGLNFYQFLEGPSDLGSLERVDKGFSSEHYLSYLLEARLDDYLGQYFEGRLSKALFLECGDRSLHYQDFVIQKNSTWVERSIPVTNNFRNIWHAKPILDRTVFSAVEKFTKICAEKKISLVVFTTAIHDDLMKVIFEGEKALDAYYQWKIDLVKITPYWDFMYPNDITSISGNYIDPSHLRKEITNYYLDKIYNTTESRSREFGQKLKTDNIDKHLDYVKGKVSVTF